MHKVSSNFSYFFFANLRKIRYCSDPQEQLRGNLEKKMQSALSDLEREKVEEINQLQKKIDNFKQQIEMQGQQYEEALRRAESDKQQALLLGSV